MSTIKWRCPIKSREELLEEMYYNGQKRWETQDAYVRHLRNAGLAQQKKFRPLKEENRRLRRFIKKMYELITKGKKGGQTWENLK